jgi:phage terminase large subunit-like protein
MPNPKLPAWFRYGFTPVSSRFFEEFIEGTLLKLAKQYTIRLCLVDPREMSYLNQRLKKKKIPIEELTQTPLHLGAAHQLLYDLFRSDRFIIPTWIDAGSIAYLRNVITRVSFTEKSGGLRFAEHQSVDVDLAAALAMACLAASRHSDQSGYTLAPFDENFRDLDLPPESEPELAPLTADSNWWRGVKRAPRMSDADDNLNDYYQQIAMGIQWGLIR